MKKYYSIHIPKPCHENWNAMSSREKGRFCSSCSKTVVNFSKMNALEVQDYIQKNKDKKICGRFKQTQLDSIHIHVPSQVLETQINFHKCFLLVLLIVMGTSLMNCTNENGTKQKINSIEVIDSIDNEVVEVSKCLPKIEEVDTLLKKACKPPKLKSYKTKFYRTQGIPVIKDVPEVTPVDIPDILDMPDIPEIIGDIKIPEEMGDIVLGYITVDKPPEFKDMPRKLSLEQKRVYFEKRIRDFVLKKFNSNVCLDLGLEGKQKIVAKFTINTNGKITEVKTRATHPKLQEEAKRVINLLPEFIPAQQRGKPVKMAYNLPIVFQVEE